MIAPDCRGAARQGGSAAARELSPDERKVTAELLGYRSETAGV